MRTDLSKYDNSWYKPGGSSLKRTLWYFVNVLFFINPLNPLSSLKVFFLRLFGAKVGKNVVIKPSVNIKYPWRLSIGNNTWIGEKVWIDNLDHVTIGSNCCISQDAMLLCGNHHFGKVTFDLSTKPIMIEDGVWIGARSVVVGGVVCESHSVLMACSLAASNLKSYGIYRGQPCSWIKERVIEE
jgi:putative colanic acid biosynthesis acetyltransferase WcaF